MNITIQNEPGWLGAFTRNEVLGAHRNGTAITKCKSEPGDATPNGTQGRVLGSMSHPVSGTVFYFVEWANKPGVAVGCMDFKIEAAA